MGPCRLRGQRLDSGQELGVHALSLEQILGLLLLAGGASNQLPIEYIQGLWIRAALVCELSLEIREGLEPRLPFLTLSDALDTDVRVSHVSKRV